MTKQREISGVKREAEVILSSIAHTTGILKEQANAYNAAVAALAAKYGQDIAALQNDLAADEKAIISLMKKNKTVLFDGVDVVNLPPGSLIHNKADHVVIPRDALQACHNNGYEDVIKKVESLDRDAIEKWPDAQLAFIGATRNPKEEFKYSLKAESK